MPLLNDSNNKKDKNKKSIFGNILNSNNKEIDDIKKNLNKEDEVINSTLFGGYTNDSEMEKNTDEDDIKTLEKKLNNINNKYKETTGNLPMEFFNRIEMDKENDNSLNSHMPNKQTNNRLKKLESLIRNSNGEFFLEEKDRFFRYEDYRLIDAYIPEVSKCLDLFRDCIFSPDDLTKKSITFFYEDTNLFSDEDNIENETQFDSLRNNLKILTKKYKLEKRFKADTREACMLGDLFYLLMPYNVGFTKILKEDDLFVNDSLETESEMYGEYITESMMGFDSDDEFNALFEDLEGVSNKSKKAKQKEETIEQAKKDILDSINNNIKYFKDPSDLISEKKKEKNLSRDLSNLEINGSIFKKLAPENVVVLELDEQILGYIYIEKNNLNVGKNRSDQRNSNPNSLRSGNTGSTINTSDSLGYGSNDIFNSRYDYLNRDQSQIKSKYALISSIFVKGISKKINKDFLKRNQEFRELIYTLVREEYITKKEIKMTFIEPQYIKHFKLASNNTYGISKISKSLFFSKIYLSILLTNLMQKIIRGRDKRAFYIETGLDDDYEDTIQGFIRDIKSKELSSGTLKNITTILNSVGAFEDYYIPIVDGQESVRIDTVPGMDVDIDNEFLQFLKRSIITGMNVAVNYIDDSTQTDFARSLTMTNNPFVRTIISDQDEFGDFYSEVVQELYRNEFASAKTRKQRNPKTGRNSKGNKIKTVSNIDIESIYIRFPTPIYLVLGNTNEQIQNAQQTIEFITSYYYPDDPTGQSNTLEREVEKAKFKKKLAKKYFLTTLDWSNYDKTYHENVFEATNDNIEDGINFNLQGKTASELDSIDEDDDF